MRITVPIGTRPEVIKLAGVVRALGDAGHDVRCVATGQHTEPQMAGRFFDELGIRPDTVWGLAGSEAERVGKLLEMAFDEFAVHRPDAVLVLGDTYTAPLTAMAARRFGIGVVHLEAGLRSFNDRSMEEQNRRMMVALATVHLAPTQMAAGFLAAEGVPAERIRVVGNPVIDALVQTGVDRVPVERRSGILVTAHRATNVDNPERLSELVAMIGRLGRDAGPVTFPVHPRTRSRLEAAGLLSTVADGPGVQVLHPLPYGALLRVLAASRLVVTDSGGLQEEASYFGIPVVVLRTTTPRWESVAAGAVVLTGLDVGRVTEAVGVLSRASEQRRIDALPCPYGDGDTAARVVAALEDPSVLAVLTPEEPAAAGGPPERVRGFLSPSAVRALSA